MHAAAVAIFKNFVEKTHVKNQSLFTKLSDLNKMGSETQIPDLHSSSIVLSRPNKSPADCSTSCA